MASIQEILHNMPPEVSAMMAYSETVGACAVSTLAAVNEGLGTCLHTIARPSFQDRVKEVLGVPERFIPVWNQLVGVPAESMEAGGQRPRQPFEETFFWGKYGQPMERDEKVVDAAHRRRAAAGPGAAASAVGGAALPHPHVRLPGGVGSMEFSRLRDGGPLGFARCRARASGRSTTAPGSSSCWSSSAQSVGVDPDTLVAKARADRDAKNGYLKELVAWAKGLPGTDRQRHDAENTIRGFFMKNGFRVVTKPYQDVYRRSGP